MKVNGHVCGNGKVKHSEFAMASGEMSSSDFTKFLQTTFKHMATFSTDGSIHYICMDWRHMQEMLAAGSEVFIQNLKTCACGTRTTVVWVACTVLNMSWCLCIKTAMYHM